MVSSAARGGVVRGGDARGVGQHTPRRLVEQPCLLGPGQPRPDPLVGHAQVDALAAQELVQPALGQLLHGGAEPAGQVVGHQRQGLAV
jgi:hypothetical protein